MTTKRQSKRAEELTAQRRAGNGSVADVAAFFGASERTVHNWKEDRVIGHTQIGSCIWFSEDDVAELPAQYHHAGKFSKVAPSEWSALVRRQWREFLGLRVADCGLRIELDEVKARLAEVERVLSINQAEPGPISANNLGAVAGAVKAGRHLAMVDAAAVSTQAGPGPNMKEAA